MAHLVSGVVIAATVLSGLQRPRRERIIRWWSARILHILNVQVQVTGSIPPVDARGVMFVANHISWLDIWTINTVKAVRFISKAEVRCWPVIGWLAAQAGTLFIERGRRQDTSRVSAAGCEVLRHGDCVCVFPEGTTTNGTYIQPFKSSLLQSAVDAEAVIWPVTIAYPDRNGQPDQGVAFADDINLLDSLRVILSRDAIKVCLEFGEPVRAAGRSRRDLAQLAEKVISSQARLEVRAAPGTASYLQAARR